ncbi:MAG: hypothetical protein Q9164_005861 [Protoblastenia rupestris]
MAVNNRTTKIRGLERVICYQFTDEYSAWEALQAPGSTSFLTNGEGLHDGNKRLAVLGDTILQLALCDDWLKTGKTRFTSISQEVASNDNLDRIGRKHGIEQFVNKNPSQGDHVSFKVMTATVEAILGAVWLDSGLDAVKRVMRVLGLVPVDTGNN